MDVDAFGETFVTLLVLMDPVGNAPIFVAITRGLDVGARRSAAVRAVLAAGVLVIGFALFGNLVLDYLGVSVDALTVAGGLLLLLVSLEMLRGTDFPTGEEDDTDVALVPLATPLVAGPGAIATVIVLAERNDSSSGQIAVVLAIVAALLVVGLTLIVAERVSRALSAGMVGFLTRVFGLLLAAISVQLVADGVSGLIRSA